MEPDWEFRWAFVEKGHWGGRKETNFWMTDAEAEKWWAYGQPGTERLEGTKRDRNAQSVDWRATHNIDPWNHGGVPYD
jgi:hypothetical protein